MSNTTDAAENIYAPPRAVVSDPPPAAGAETPFFAVSPLKLVIMSLGTLTFYQLFWIYQNWNMVHS